MTALRETLWSVCERRPESLTVSSFRHAVLLSGDLLGEFRFHYCPG